MKSIIIYISLIFISGFILTSSIAALNQEEQEMMIASTVSKCAMKVFDTEWFGYDEPLKNDFSEQELAILLKYEQNLQTMIEFALRRQDSVHGAKFAAHFKMTLLIPLLRSQLFEPRHCYGYEGPDYSKIESYLYDEQYQYSMAYLMALEKLSGKSIDSAIILTKEEADILNKYSENKNSEFFHWALWMQKKLKIINK